MTWKDYELIAWAILEAKLTNRPLEWVLANQLAATNPRFDRERFLEACGPVERYVEEVLTEGEES